MQMSSKGFSLLLREKRVSKKMSIRGLGRLTVIDFTTIAKIEKGEFGTTLDSAIRIAKALDFSLDDACSPFRTYDKHLSEQKQKETKFLNPINFKFQTIKQGRRKNISKLAVPFHSVILIQGILLLLTGPKSRLRVPRGTLIDCRHLIESLTWALAMSDAELFWIGDVDQKQ